MLHFKRSSFDFIQDDIDAEPVSSNYYPITTGAFISDPSTGEYLSVLTDRAEGGGSITDGNLEVMLHRRLLRDDYKGVGEPLNETAFGEGLVVRGTHKVSVGKLGPDQERDFVVDRRLMNANFLQPVLLFAEQTLPYSEWDSAFSGPRSFAGLDDDLLPEAVSVMTLMHQDGDLLLRLEHLYGPDDSALLGVAVSVDLEDLFAPAGVKVLGFVEMALGGNVPLDSVQRLRWDTLEKREEKSTRSEDVGLSVSLEPMQIRTFLVNVERQ